MKSCFKQFNILLIEGRARQVLPMAKSLRKLGCIVTTYNVSRLDPGYASKYPQRKLLSYFDPKEPETTFGFIKKELERYHYDLIIPLTDDAAILLSQHKNELGKLATIAVEDQSVFRMASDKFETMQVCMENSIPCPFSFGSIDEYLRNKTKLQFPVVVKPRTGCAAVGFYVAKNEDDVITYYERAERKYGNMLIQEYIPQDGLQYKCELYIDRTGQLKGACVFAKVRWYPINGGSSTLNETVDRPDIISMCKKLLEKIGWQGYADIDLIEDKRDGKVKVMEINPRITGSVKICFEAGVNFSQLFLEDFNQEDVTPQFDVKHKYLRYFHTDFLWFIKSPDRFKCQPSWFSFKNTTDQIFSWSDLWVFFAYTLQGFSKFIKDKKRRSL